MTGTILQPVVVLAGWTLAMLVWAVAVRFRAMAQAGIRLGTLTGTTGASADRALPREAHWKARNYNHLTEQPTVFYAIALVLVVAGQGGGAAAGIGWAYVALRIGHSLVQATVNRVLPRFVLFVLSSLCLAALIALAAAAVF